MKTTKTYSEAIRHKYIVDKEYDKLRGEIYRLTPANIRKLCLNLINEDLSQSDKTILKNNFEADDFSNIRKAVKNLDIEVVENMDFINKKVKSDLIKYLLENITIEYKKENI